MMSSESENFLFRFLEGTITVKQFEDWFHRTASLENEIPRQIYRELLDLRYVQRHTDHDIKSLIMNFVDLGRFEEWKLRKILNSIIEKEQIATSTIDKCYDLYSSNQVHKVSNEFNRVSI